MYYVQNIKLSVREGIVQIITHDILRGEGLGNTIDSMLGIYCGNLHGDMGFSDMEVCQKDLTFGYSFIIVRTVTVGGHILVESYSSRKLGLPRKNRSDQRNWGEPRIGNT